MYSPFVRLGNDWCPIYLNLINKMFYFCELLSLLYPWTWLNGSVDKCIKCPKHWDYFLGKFFRVIVCLRDLTLSFFYKIKLGHYHPFGCTKKFLWKLLTNFIALFFVKNKNFIRKWKIRFEKISKNNIIIDCEAVAWL